MAELYYTSTNGLLEIAKDNLNSAKGDVAVLASILVEEKFHVLDQKILHNESSFRTRWMACVTPTTPGAEYLKEEDIYFVYIWLDCSFNTFKRYAKPFATC